MLTDNAVQPHKIRYYLERRDPDFKQKMQGKLMVYQEVTVQNEKQVANGIQPSVITVSIDEKPGVQAIKNIAPDLPPKRGVSMSAISKAITRRTKE